MHSRSYFSPFHSGSTGINSWGWAGKGSMSGRTRDCSTRSRIASVCGQNLEPDMGRSAPKPRAQFEPVKMRGLPTARVAAGLFERRICLKLQKKFRLKRPPGGRWGVRYDGARGARSARVTASGRVTRGGQLILRLLHIFEGLRACYCTRGSAGKRTTGRHPARGVRDGGRTESGPGLSCRAMS